MQRLLAAVVTIAWALWFGGVVMLLLAVSSLFHTFVHEPTVEALAPFGVSTEAAAVPNSPLRRVLAGSAAGGVFHRFERYQLAVAAVALLATFGWRLTGGGPPRLKTALFALLALATVAAVVNTTRVTPRVDAIRVEALRRGQDVSLSPKKAEFGKLHGISMAVYTTEAALLLLAGLVLPFATRADVATALQSDADARSAANS
jgi:hypothetical protein